ncbi:MAG: hypothetical protein QME73_06700 [Bacillota bacterium]|nr:hypothetical protein [Bacillota bacterium]
MPKTKEYTDIRYIKMHMDALGINYIHRSQPWTAAWWSAALPGFGHLYLGCYLKGLVLITGEIFINIKARINLAILYTFIGNFEKANHVFNDRWGLFYAAIWVFSIYDAYTLAVKTNQLCELEEAQKTRYFTRSRVCPIGISFLAQRNPVLAAFFSFVLGGMGQIYNSQYVKGFILIFWVFIINYYSQFNHLLVKTLTGKEIFLQQVDWQWLLFYPSIIGFCIWDSYVGAVEINRLFIEEQRYEISKNMSSGTSGDVPAYPAYLVGMCRQSVNLELLTNSLEKRSMKKYQIIFLDRVNNKYGGAGNSNNTADGMSNFNGAICGATIFMLLGTIWGGTILPGGPILVGISGFVLGAVIGYLADRYASGWIRAKLNLRPVERNNAFEGEVMLFVKVEEKAELQYAVSLFAEHGVCLAGTVEGDTFNNFVLA